MVSYKDKIEEDRKAVERAEASISAAILDGMSAEEIARVLRPDVARELQQRVMSGQLGNGDLVKLLGMLNDRIDGKVTENVNLNANMTLSSIYDSVKGLTAGLPRDDVIDIVPQVVYDEGDTLALKSEVDDGERII